MFLIIIFIIIGCTYGGIRFLKRKRVVSIFLFSPLLAVISFIGYFIYHTLYHTTPDSLQLTVHKENEAYFVGGVWKDRLDAYRFPADFLVFYVPNNEKVSNVKRNRVKSYNEMDGEFLEKEVQNWFGQKTHLEWEPQIFDLNTNSEFEFTFDLPGNVKPSDVELYYIHTREEPMEALEFWSKKIELK